MKILEAEGPLCFVRLTKEYFKKLDSAKSNAGCTVVPKIRAKKNGELTCFPNTTATDSACRAAFSASLANLGLDSSLYGLHSGKIGGVVHLRNAGTSWRSIDRL